MRSAGIAFIGPLVLLLALFSTVASHATGRAVDGDALFHIHCAACHGEKGVGQDPAFRSGGWRDDGSRLAPALDGSAHSWHHEPELLYDYVKSGSVDPESPMPAFGDNLNEEQIQAIIYYFQSLWPGKIRRIYLERFPGSLE